LWSLINLLLVLKTKQKALESNIQTNIFFPTPTQNTRGRQRARATPQTSHPAPISSRGQRSRRGTRRRRSFQFFFGARSRRFVRSPLRRAVRACVSAGVIVHVSGGRKKEENNIK